LSPLQAAVLGLIQGLTEFLPISSSGHLVLASRALGWSDQGLAFDMAAHCGSLLAVLAYFRADLVRFGRALAAPSAGGPETRRDARLAWTLLLATLPVAVGGLLTQELMAGAARRPALIAVTSIVFAVLLGWADRRAPRRALDDLDRRSGVAIGFAQALALVPGTSRSGVTITAGRLAGLDREGAARFSFLLSIPVGLLVAAKEVLDLARAGDAAGGGWAALFVGFTVSALSAYAAIGWLLAWLRRRGLMPFVVYRILLGAAILLLLYYGSGHHRRRPLARGDWRWFAGPERRSSASPCRRGRCARSSTARRLNARSSSTWRSAVRRTPSCICSPRRAKRGSR